MIRTTTIVVLSFGPLAGCTDADGDGLSNSHEHRIGTSIHAPDTDGDRLDDGLEVELGTDPLRYDTDSDGYADGDEVTEGTDPLDPTSRIYAGGWPYYWNKDDIPASDWSMVPTVGAYAPRFVATDGYGEQVDLFDFAYRDAQVLIQLCPLSRCDDHTDFVTGTSDTLGPTFEPLRNAVSDGRLLWINVVHEYRGESPTVPEHRTFQQAFPTIPALLDDESRFADWLLPVSPGAWRNWIWLREDMRIQRFDSPADPTDGYTLDLLNAYFAALETE